MKTIRVDHSKGLNAVTDRRMMPEGYMVLADNVDLRSGSARCMRVPQFHLAAPTGTTCIYEYRGQWHFSEKYRTYAAEFVGSQERIYYAETGAGHVPPKKIVDGVEANLGTIVPLASPIASNINTLTPINISLSASGGSLPVGQYSYRISAIINGNTLAASQATTISLTAAGGVSLSWGAVTNATGYVVFGRTPGKEQTLKTLGVTTTWVDDGSQTPSGPYASTYDAETPYRYVYTYVREVGRSQGGMQDEGGPSPVSVVAQPGSAHRITRLPLNDGFYIDAPISTTMTSVASSDRVTIGGILKKGARTLLTIDAIPDPVDATALIADTEYTITYLGTTDFTLVGAFANMVGIRFKATGVATGDGTVAQWKWAPTNTLRFYDGTSYLYPATEGITFVYPTALAAPSGLSAIDEGSVSTLSAGTYQYAVSAIRGETSGLSNGVTVPETAISSTVDITPTVNPSTGAMSAVRLAWSTSIDADGYNVYRSADAGATWSLIAMTVGYQAGYVDTGTAGTAVTPPTDDTGTSTRILVLTNQDLPTAITATLDPYAYLSRTECTVPVSGVLDKDVVFLAGCAQSALNGVQRTHFMTDTTFWVPVFTQTNDAATSLLDVPNNGYYKYWNIYRSGDSGSQFLLVAQVPIDKSYYDDSVGVTGLGGTISSSYTDENGAVVVYAPPASDAFCPTLYNGMLAMIRGNTVSWSPSGIPDAQPVAYSQSFSFPPMALASFAGGLIVFCPDGTYRLDGFSPGTMSLHRTKADGCIAPYSVQQVGNTLVYLSKRGIMLFDGVQAQCITEAVIPYKLFIMPSVNALNPSTGLPLQDFWWQTTDNTSQYGALLWQDANSIPYQDPYGDVFARDIPKDGVVKNIRSFVWQNKYYLYFTDALGNDFAANTAWCLDLGAPDHPVTTFGMKATDSHVSSTGDAYVLLKTYGGISWTDQKIPEWFWDNPDGTSTVYVYVTGGSSWHWTIVDDHGGLITLDDPDGSDTMLVGYSDSNTTFTLHCLVDGTKLLSQLITIGSP